MIRLLPLLFLCSCKGMQSVIDLPTPPEKEQRVQPVRIDTVGQPLDIEPPSLSRLLLYGGAVWLCWTLLKDDEE